LIPEENNDDDLIDKINFSIEALGISQMAFLQ
jgi:hypothetical protein